jgi:hypothetical protein
MDVGETAVRRWVGQLEAEQLGESGTGSDRRTRGHHGAGEGDHLSDRQPVVPEDRVSVTPGRGGSSAIEATGTMPGRTSDGGGKERKSASR